MDGDSPVAPPGGAYYDIDHGPVRLDEDAGNTMPPTEPARTLSSPRMRWRAVLALVGLLALAAVVYGAGADQIVDQIRTLGWTAPLILIPYGIGVFLDARGLGAALPSHGRGAPIPLGRLTRLRLAGEAINSITPTAYLGGEPLKAHLLHRAGIPGPDAVAAVVVAKTAVIASQIIFVVSGLVLFLGRHEDTTHPVAMAALPIVLAVAVVLALVEVQRRGLVAAVAARVARLFPRSHMLGRLHAHAGRIDERLTRLYGRGRAAFLASTGFHLAGWLVGVGEVMIVLALLGTPVDIGTALIIESLSGTIRALSFLIPGTIGVQELGGAFLCRMMGVPAVPALSLMLLKRGREMLFTLLGLLILGRSHHGDAVSHGRLSVGVTSAS